MPAPPLMLAVGAAAAETSRALPEVGMHAPSLSSFANYVLQVSRATEIAAGVTTHLTQPVC
ncbi:hypothetical protein PF005_g11443 [Phytophthora fragariae]|uniref:Uncharacterized protein n=1 Tax=Phytophthora fragariae TaxID=53985 RepID=A0A6A3XY61_9STRA|nr:hypothetical protein PF003_g35017 [Phytophthora fragariae]KAE8937533.1 hypothetical protein PF009_g12569 [Phytophthora fragariae]KAE9110653.1 hypothetical protein PF010_g11085 [Phytophthora fragariae]KAE9137721.1 hypothetical protein PF007_g1706 [Phytophthora fragariae]KAE9152251.1 hypothetical protein PF006_g3535 [Phytophthora fragariae]